MRYEEDISWKWECLTVLSRGFLLLPLGFFGIEVSTKTNKKEDLLIRINDEMLLSCTADASHTLPPAVLLQGICTTLVGNVDFTSAVCFS